MNGQECRTKTVEIDGVVRDRIPYPPNYDWMGADEFPETCRDCGVTKGGIHHERCRMEDCPACGGQLLSCDHGPHAG